MGQKQCCSFREADWNIGKYPAITPTLTGRERRAEEARKKRKKTLQPSGTGDRVIAEPESVSGTQESVSSIVTRARSKAVDREVVSMPAPSTSRIPGPVPVASVDPPLVAGKTYHFYLENFHPYAYNRAIPSRTSGELKVQAVELRGIMDREEGEIRALAGMIRGRAKIMEDMLDELDREICNIDGIAPSSESGDGDEEAEEQDGDADFGDDV
jgi:hypothetical protein